MVGRNLEMARSDKNSAWVTKHFVEVNTATVTAVMQWARHAEKLIKPKTSSSEFWTNDILENVYYHQGARPRGRGRGGHRGGVGGRGRGQNQIIQIIKHD